MFKFSQHVSALRMALQFLTVFPVGKIMEQDKSTTGLSLLYYPLVGLLLGFVLAVFAWFAQSVLSIYSLQIFLLAALVLTLWVVLTGALHLDGLADCADAWMGGLGSRSRTLELMKDPTSGPIAVTVVVLLLLIKLACLVALLAHASLWLLLLAPFVARLAVLALMLITPYVRPQGLGEILSKHFPRQEAKIVMAIMVVVFLLLNFSQGLVILLVTAVVLLVLRTMMMSRLKGCTGDTLGATVELVEVTCLVVLAALL
ncbi:MAG: adenosylcobinamide-GDP ribazoletransferase [Pseudomonadales bacterium]